MDVFSWMLDVFIPIYQYHTNSLFAQSDDEFADFASLNSIWSQNVKRTKVNPRSNETLHASCHPFTVFLPQDCFVVVVFFPFPGHVPIIQNGAEEFACPLSNCDNLLGHISSKDNPAKWHIKSTSREQCAASHYAVSSRTVLAGYRGVFTPQQQTGPVLLKSNDVSASDVLRAYELPVAPYFVVR